MRLVAATILAAPPTAGAAAAVALARAAMERFGETGLATGGSRRIEEMLRALGRAGADAGGRGRGRPVARASWRCSALVAEGLTNRQIAERLVISEHTAIRHVANVFRKLGAGNRATAVRLATQRGPARGRDGHLRGARIARPWDGHGEGPGLAWGHVRDHRWTPQRLRCLPGRPQPLPGPPRGRIPVVPDRARRRSGRRGHEGDHRGPPDRDRGRARDPRRRAPPRARLLLALPARPRRRRPRHARVPRRGLRRGPGGPRPHHRRADP